MSDASTGKNKILCQLVATLTAFLTIYLSGVWLSWVSAVLPKIRADELHIDLSEDDISWMVALMDIGNLLSPIPCGYLMDRLGRLPALRLSALFFGVASMLALTATKPFHLHLARFFAGMGKGVGYTTAPLYVGEIAGPKIRGALSGIFIIMLTSGSASTMTFGPWISFNYLNWATLAFPIIILVLSAIIPESPYFYYMHSDEAAAKSAFIRLRGSASGGVPDESGSLPTENTELLAIKKKVQNDMEQSTSFATLFTSRSNRKALRILLFTNAFQRLGGISCIFAYASTTLPTDSFWDPRITLMVFGWSGAISGTIASPLIDSFGRKPLLLISNTALCLLTGQSAVFYYFHQLTSVDMSRYYFMPHMGIMLYGLFYAIGIGQVPHTLQSELLPTNVKSQASAVATIVLSICSFITNKVYLPVYHGIGVWAMYLEFSLSALCCALFAIFFIFETKGKTLSEIQTMLEK